MPSAMNRIRKFLKEKYDALLHIRDSPHAIAGGVAIGIFMGFTPFLGFKTLLAIAVAWLTRCSKVAAAIAVTLHDTLWIIPPLTPLLVRVEYEIGYWIVHHQLPPKITKASFDFHKWLHWDVFIHIGWPLLLGSIVLGVPTALVSYFLTFTIVRDFQKRRQKAEAKKRKLESGSLEK